MGNAPQKPERQSKLVYSTDKGDLRKADRSGSGDGMGSEPQGVVRVRLDTKARRGKAVTMITGIQHCPQVIEDLARKLKVLCGSGGTVEGKDILIQGDHREKVTAHLTGLGYKVKAG